MQRSEFIKKIEGILEATPGSLTGAETLKHFPAWDSLTLMGFIALAHGGLGIKLTGKQVIEAQTVNDLVGLCESKLTD